MNRWKTVFLVFTLFLLPATFISLADAGDNPIFQVAPITSLMEGLYDGTLTFSELKKHGDFGIGTFDGLDGEMIGLKGQFFQIKIDGKAYPVPDAEKTPFSIVTFFAPEREILLDQPLDYAQMEKFLDRLLPTTNIPYAIRLEGSFQSVKTRSVPRQGKPFRRLVDAAGEQKTFEFGSVRGTLAGFRFPDYVKGVNIPGYHFHFITDDRKAGGHLLDCRIDRVKVDVQYAHRLDVWLPSDGSFYRAVLGEGKAAELNRVEKEKK